MGGYITGSSIYSTGRIKFTTSGAHDVLQLHHHRKMTFVPKSYEIEHKSCRAGATSPVGQVSTGPLLSPNALTADLGDYDVRGSIDERSTGSTELAA